LKLIVFFLGGWFLITFLRPYVHLIVSGSVIANTSSGIHGLLFETIKEVEIEKLFLVVPTLLGRIESFTHLWLASNVNPSVFGGGYNVFLKTLYWPLVDLGHDAVHLEVLGVTVPESLYNVSGSILAYACWASGESWLYLILFAFYGCSYLILIEKVSQHVIYKYNFDPFVIKLFLITYCIVFYTSIGSPLLMTLFIVLIFLFIFPKFSFITRSVRFLKLDNI
jgi:hypothetical protein